MPQGNLPSYTLTARTQSHERLQAMRDRSRLAERESRMRSNRTAGPTQARSRTAHTSSSQRRAPEHRSRWQPQRVIASTAEIAGSIVIAGPLASGTDSCGRLVAEHLDLALIEIELAWRACAFAGHSAGIPGSRDWIAAVETAGIDFEWLSPIDVRVEINGKDATDILSGRDVNALVAEASESAGAAAEVASLLHDAGTLAGPLVLAGRGAGVLAFAGTATHCFLTASQGERAARLRGYEDSSGQRANRAATLQIIRRNDAADRERGYGVQGQEIAAGYTLIDTERHSAGEAATLICNAWRRASRNQAAPWWRRHAA